MTISSGFFERREIEKECTTVKPSLGTGLSLQNVQRLATCVSVLRDSLYSKTYGRVPKVTGKELVHEHEAVTFSIDDRGR